MQQTKKLIAAALCAALCVILPMVFHAIPNAGSIFLPMHIPVLLCGFLCGWPYGLACGLLGPCLSSLITSMPPAAILPSMACELAMYGLVTGFLSRRVKTGRRTADIYISLITAMLCGRVLSGVLNALIFRAGAYSLELWLAAAFTTALPGIVIQLVLIPMILTALARSGLAARFEGKSRLPEGQE